MASTDRTRSEGLRPARRTIVKGAAWAVPVVAVAAPASAQTASQYVWIEHLEGACKLPGNSCAPLTKGYMIPVRICTNVRGLVTIDFSTVNGTLCGANKSWDAQPDPLQIQGSADGSEVCRTDVRFGVVDESDSANCAISGLASYSWTSSNGLSGSGSFTFSADATPPCDHCEVPPPEEPAAIESEAETSADPETQTAVEEPSSETNDATTAEEPAPSADTAETTSQP